MPTNDPPPAGVRLRVRPRPLRRSAAAGLLLAVCAANQSAARDGPASIPYLLHAPPKALRIAPPPIILAAPPRPGDRPPETAGAPDDTAPTADTAPPDGSAPPGEAAPAESANPARSGQPGATPASGPGAPEPVRTLPDTYAPAAPARVEDFLPYLIPDTRASSRAVYELK